MTGTYTSMTARFPRCHKNPISIIQPTSRPLHHNTQKNCKKNHTTVETQDIASPLAQIETQKQQHRKDVYNTGKINTKTQRNPLPQSDTTISVSLRSPEKTGKNRKESATHPKWKKD